MPRAKQTPEEIAEMRARILDAVARILKREGPEALSIRAIAEVVGVSHMALYTYFENREALMRAFVARQRERSHARREAALRRAEQGDARAVLREQLAHYSHLARRHPRLYQFLWVHPAGRTDLDPLGLEHEIPADEVRTAHNVEHLARLVELCIARGECVARDPTIAATVALSIVHGPLILYHNGRLPDLDLLEAVLPEALDAAMAYLMGDEVARDRQT